MCVHVCVFILYILYACTHSIILAFLFCLFTGQPGVTAIPTCNMRVMRKHVVNKLSPYWSVVCKQLGYPTEGLGQDNKKNLIAVLEAWINDAEKEGRPKTWPMFIEALSSISELSAVTSEICNDLKREGIHLSESNL